MTTPNSPRGPWIHRFSIRFFTVIFAVLVFWVLGFLLDDIEAIPGPDYGAVEAEYVDDALLEKQKSLTADIADLDRDIRNKRDEMRIVSDSSQNLQKTINQLIELQKLTVRQSGTLPEKEPVDLSESLSHFIQSQERYQAHNAELSELTARMRSLEAEQHEIGKTIEEQRKPAREEYENLREKHDFRLAFLQLLILLPLLAAAAFFVVKRRDSIYFPLFLGFGAATLVKTGLVIHAYFPTRYVKYILVIGLLAAVIKVLIYFIRSVAFPGSEWLNKQYREAYERFLCPVCEYPIRTGPRKFLFWTRRTVNKIVLPNESHDEEPYSCPACGTTLFEECPECDRIRHSLLPYCEHCDASKEISLRPEHSKDGGND